MSVNNKQKSKPIHPDHRMANLRRHFPFSGGGGSGGLAVAKQHSVFYLPITSEEDRNKCFDCVIDYLDTLEKLSAQGLKTSSKFSHLLKGTMWEQPAVQLDRAMFDISEATRKFIVQMREDLHSMTQMCQQDVIIQCFRFFLQLRYESLIAEIQIMQPGPGAGASESTSRIYKQFSKVVSKMSRKDYVGGGHSQFYVNCADKAVGGPVADTVVSAPSLPQMYGSQVDRSPLVGTKASVPGASPTPPLPLTATTQENQACSPPGTAAAAGVGSSGGSSAVQSPNNGNLSLHHSLATLPAPSPPGVDDLVQYLSEASSAPEAITAQVNRRYHAPGGQGGRAPTAAVKRQGVMSAPLMSPVQGVKPPDDTGRRTWQPSSQVRPFPLPEHVDMHSSDQLSTFAEFMSQHQQLSQTGNFGFSLWGPHVNNSDPALWDSTLGTSQVEQVCNYSRPPIHSTENDVLSTSMYYQHHPPRRRHSSSDGYSGGAQKRVDNFHDGEASTDSIFPRRSYDDLAMENKATTWPTKQTYHNQGIWSTSSDIMDP